jgi:cellulose synthase/poly-beta-1,6-N-acetylglucosamine synthase-like glycosyltransferase
MGFLAVLSSLYSQLLGLRFDREVSASLKRASSGFKPRVCLVMACRGDEFRLRENVEAILNQTYPNYHAIIVTDSVDDPAYSIVKSVLELHPTFDAHLYTADPHPQASGKVAALLTALERDEWLSDTYAFVDSDAAIPRRWLQDLVQPLKDSSEVCTTGFRWYFPVRSGFWSQVQSVWNASGSNLMFNERYNFPWGGAMAIPTQTLKTIDVRRVWETAISDDLSLNSALRKHSQRIMFLPECTVATYNQATMRSFLSWAIRQVTLTRGFNRRLWSYGLMAYAFFAAIMVLGVVSLIAGFISSPVWFLPAILLFTPSILGVLRSNQRVSTFKRALPEFAADFDRNRVPHSIASLIVPVIMTYCIIKSIGMREIEWRGRTYKLSGANALAST